MRGLLSRIVRSLARRRPELAAVEPLSTTDSPPSVSSTVAPAHSTVDSPTTKPALRPLRDDSAREAAVMSALAAVEERRLAEFALARQLSRLEKAMASLGQADTLARSAVEAGDLTKAAAFNAMKVDLEATLRQLLPELALPRTAHASALEKANGAISNALAKGVHEDEMSISAQSLQRAAARLQRRELHILAEAAQHVQESTSAGEVLEADKGT